MATPTVLPDAALSSVDPSVAEAARDLACRMREAALDVLSTEIGGEAGRGGGGSEPSHPIFDLTNSNNQV